MARLSRKRTTDLRDGLEWTTGVARTSGTGVG